MNFIKYDKEEIKKRTVVDNPWWQSNKTPEFYRSLRKRAYFLSFFSLVTTQKPNWALEVKWSNAIETGNLSAFMQANDLSTGWMTTIDQYDLIGDVRRTPASIMCYMIGKTPEIITEEI